MPFLTKKSEKMSRKMTFSSKNFFPKTMTQQRRTLLLQNKWLSIFSESKRDRRARWRNYQCKFLQLFFHIFNCKNFDATFLRFQNFYAAFLCNIFLAIATKKNRYRTSITKWLCFICKFMCMTRTVWVILLYSLFDTGGRSHCRELRVALLQRSQNLR